MRKTGERRPLRPAEQDAASRARRRQKLSRAATWPLSARMPSRKIFENATLAAESMYIGWTATPAIIPRTTTGKNGKHGGQQRNMYLHTPSEGAT